MTTHSKPLYQRIAQTLQAMENCERSGNGAWMTAHTDTAHNLTKEYMPSGSGFDSGTTLSGHASAEKLIFYTAFHHMNDGGYYDGWSNHTVTITPSLASGFNIKVSGRDRNQIKDYIAETFDCALRRDVSDDECQHCYVAP